MLESKGRPQRRHTFETFRRGCNIKKTNFGGCPSRKFKLAMSAIAGRIIHSRADLEEWVIQHIATLTMQGVCFDPAVVKKVGKAFRASRETTAVAVIPSGGDLARNAELVGEFFPLSELRNNKRISVRDLFKVVEGRGASVLVLIGDQS